jgi:outer membrane protein OmpA-like peptidoglycan-associated protein
VIRTKHAVFVLGAAFAAAPISIAWAETVGNPPVVLAQGQPLTPQQQQQQEEENKRRQQKRQDDGGRSQGGGGGEQRRGGDEGRRGGGGEERRGGGGDERRGGGGGEQRRDFGQPPGGGGGGRPPQQGNEDQDRRRGGGGEERQRRELGQQPGSPAGRPPQEQGQDRRRELGQQPAVRPPQQDDDDQDRRRRGGEDRQRRELGQQPGGQPGRLPGGQDSQDPRRGDDRGRGDGRPPQIGGPGGPGDRPAGPGDGRPPQIGGPGGPGDRPGGPGDGRPPQIGGPGGPGDRPGGPGDRPGGPGDRDGRQLGGDRDRDRGDGGRTFETFRPQISPEERRERREERREFSRERLQDVVKGRRERREGDRVIIEEPDRRRIIRGEGGRFIIRHDESARFRGRGRDYREERGPGNNKIIVINRGGLSIHTEVDQEGKLIRRWRKGRDGRDFVLIDNRDRGDYRRRRGERRGGPGIGFYIDLPAPVVRIPRDRYYVYADRASEEDIEETLSAPPVEDIEPEYTLDEIRSSPRLRERMPSVNLNTINFEFGSWELGEDQFGRLGGMAKAIENILRRNADEVFLIEGHTDAVGSDEDNLSLSDRRAESVARVLTDEFNIPPENLVTQGYGEQHLLVNTDQAERSNRRVEFRRITPLLARDEARAQ